MSTLNYRCIVNCDRQESPIVLCYHLHTIDDEGKDYI